MYEIAVRGRLPDDWSYWFDGFTVVVSSTAAGPITTLTGPVADQAELHGVLARIRDLALPIEWVRCIDRDHLGHPNTPLDT